MITIILSIISVVTYMFVKGYREQYKYVTGICLGLVGGFSLTIVLGVFFPKEIVECEKIPIVSIADNTTTEGAMFLGSGTIKEVPYYFFYYDLGDGDYKLGQRASNECVIRYYDGDPYIQQVNRRVIKGWNYWGYRNSSKNITQSYTKLTII